MNDLGKRISRLRKEHGWTQAELGIKLNVTAQAVSKWENDVSEPDIQTLLRLATLFGITLDEMLTAPDNEPEEAEQELRPNIPPDTATIGFCVTCGRLLKEGEAAELRPAIRCITCKEKADEEEREKQRLAEEERTRAALREKEERERAEKAKKAAEAAEASRLENERLEKKAKLASSLIWSAIITVVVVVIAVVIDVKMAYFRPLHILGFVAFTYFTFAFVAQLFFGSDFVFDCVVWGLTRTVRFPGIIFSLDINGCLFFIGVKILFAILGFIAGVFFAVLGIAFGMLCSGFMFPFALSHKLHGE